MISSSIETRKFYILQDTEKSQFELHPVHIFMTTSLDSLMVG